MATKTKKRKRVARVPGTLAELVQAVRAKEGLSYTEMGALVGASRGALCDIERGRRLISAALAARWAEALGYEAKPFVQLALQADIDAAGLKLRVLVR
jgi:transcriptional regulator with XRE-family HTH domain